MKEWPIRKRDVAILGLQMPGADGTEILETLKQNHKFIENIMLTLYIAAHLPAEWITLGRFKNLGKSCDTSKHLLTNEKIPMTICQHTVQSDMHKNARRQTAEHAFLPGTCFFLS